MYETSITMLESAVYHMEDAQSKLGELDLMSSVTKDFANIHILS